MYHGTVGMVPNDVSGCGVGGMQESELNHSTVPTCRGYPCKITSSATEYICEDKQGLEGSLAELLRDPEVAEECLAVMKFEPPVKETEEGEEESPNPQ